MKDGISTQALVALLAVLVIGLGSHAVYVESAKKEPSSYQAIGTLSITVTPVPTATGAEFVSILFRAPGTYDFTGWTIETESGNSHIIDSPAVTTGEKVVVCGEDIADLECTDLFDDPDTLTDGTGVVKIYDADGGLVSTIEYEGFTAGKPKTVAPDFKATVYSGNASIEFCRATNQAEFVLHKGNVSTIIAGKSHADMAGGSIIPSFFYNLGDGVQYFEGLNWPDTTGVYANGCNL